MSEELKEFIEENDFVLVCHDLDLFECAGGHIWHIDHIQDLMQSEAQKKSN